jgi:hypothetical protein
MQSNFINDNEKKAVEILSKIDQAHLYANLDKHTKEEREAFANQVTVTKHNNFKVLLLESSYPGGLANYYNNALVCLKAAIAGDNPYEGYNPKIPASISKYRNIEIS